MAKASYDLTGQIAGGRDYPIAAATAIKEGSYVKLASGKVINVVAGETAAILGIAMEPHTGTADTFNVRSNGTAIRVNDSPTLVTEFAAPQATATSGSTTTFAATALATFVDDDFKGGFLKIISKVSTSTNTDPVGTTYEITGSTAATKLFTFAAAGGAITVGDVMEIFPPIGFAKGNFDATFSKYDLTATAAMPIKVSGMDMPRNLVLVEAALHLNGNKAS